MESILRELDITIRPAKNANELVPAWQNIAGNRHIHGEKENRLKFPYLAALKSFTFQKRSKEMLLNQRANHDDHKQ